MPSAEESIAAQQEVKEWYRQYLIKVHGNHPTLIAEVMRLVTYEEIREIYGRETGRNIGPYSGL